MEKLIAYIKSLVHIEDEIINEILPFFDYKLYKKEQAVIHKGQYVTKYYFIKSGGVRIVLDTEEKEITAWLIFENQFFTDLTSLKSGRATQANILTIENTEIFSIEATIMHQLYKQYPIWQEFGRKIMEDAFLNLVNSLVSFQVMDAEARYLHLMSQSDAIHRIPLKQLASYLGITPTSLSRIRKNIQ